MLAAFLLALLALAAFLGFLLAHLAAVIAIGLILAGRRPIDHLATRAHRRGHDIGRGLDEATARQQRQQRHRHDQDFPHHSALLAGAEARAKSEENTSELPSIMRHSY